MEYNWAKCRACGKVYLLPQLVSDQPQTGLCEDCFSKNHENILDGEAGRQ
jgi:uncharacterized OB-fold protein